MPNRLADESSPYLLQHANNPVDWYPWGPEAIEKSRREDKPIFLSIGYSACHWCHVMEHESFENAEIAAQLNQHFVAIKVDREERPDVDQIYMNALQLMGGHGGWPLSMFLTPDLHPFFGGTYWPESNRGGMPGFPQVLEAVLEAWSQRREQANQQAQELVNALNTIGVLADSETMFPPQLFDLVVTVLERNFDTYYGGFGRKPKFPHPIDLRLLMHLWHKSPKVERIEMVTLTLDKMAAGGIYDQLGGGFHRYSVDERWLVPHFEKMLYDNAQLATVYAEAYQLTGKPQYATVVRETLDYLLREMTDPQGGVYSTEDADSEGVEGKFYVWTPAEIAAVLGAEAEVFCKVYDVSVHGNFEEANILNLPKTIAQHAKLIGRDEADLAAELARGRAKLFAAREERVRPGRDDKVIVAWNGLAIEGFAVAGRILDEPRYIDAARRAAEFILTQLVRPDGRLLHTWRQGQAKLDAYLDDYACLVQGLIALYEATFDASWLREGLRLAEIIAAQFADPTAPGFFFTAADHEPLISRNKEVQDGSTPSSNSMAATALWKLGRYTGRNDLVALAEATLRGYAEVIQRYPSAMGQMLLAVDAYFSPLPELVLAGDASSPAMREIFAALRGLFIPNRLIALADPSAGEPPAELKSLLAGKAPINGEPALYVCQHFACQAPITGTAAIIEKLRTLAASKPTGGI